MSLCRRQIQYRKADSPKSREIAPLPLSAHADIRRRRERAGVRGASDGSYFLFSPAFASAAAMAPPNGESDFAAGLLSCMNFRSFRAIGRSLGASVFWRCLRVCRRSAW